MENTYINVCANFEWNGPRRLSCRILTIMCTGKKKLLYVDSLGGVLSPHDLVLDLVTLTTTKKSALLEGVWVSPTGLVSCLRWLCLCYRGLTIHQRRLHQDVKEFSCSVCGKGFDARYILTQHMRTHTGINCTFKALWKKYQYKLVSLLTFKIIYVGTTLFYLLVAKVRAHFKGCYSVFNVKKRS